MKPIIEIVRVAVDPEGNANRLFFHLNRNILGSRAPRIFCSLDAAEGVSKLASGLLRHAMLRDGKPAPLVESVEYGADFITVTLQPYAVWDEKYRTNFTRFITANLNSKIPLLLDEQPDVQSVRNPEEAKPLEVQALAAIEKWSGAYWQEWSERKKLEAALRQKPIITEFINSAGQVTTNKTEARAVRAALPDGTKLLATASRLKLESAVTDDALRHMVLYAAKVWGKQCAVNFPGNTNSEEVKLKLWVIAQAEGVQIKDYKPSATKEQISDLRKEMGIAEPQSWREQMIRRPERPAARPANDAQRPMPEAA